MSTPDTQITLSPEEEHLSKVLAPIMLMKGGLIRIDRVRQDLDRISGYMTTPEGRELAINELTKVVNDPGETELRKAMSSAFLARARAALPDGNSGAEAHGKAAEGENTQGETKGKKTKKRVANNTDADPNGALSDASVGDGEEQRDRFTQGNTKFTPAKTRAAD